MADICGSAGQITDNCQCAVCTDLTVPLAVFHREPIEMPLEDRTLSALPFVYFEGGAVPVPYFSGTPASPP